MSDTIPTTTREVEKLPDRIAELRAVESELKVAEQVFRDERKSIEEELAPRRAIVDALKDRKDVLRSNIREEMIHIHDTSKKPGSNGVTALAGVQIKRKYGLEVINPELAIEQFRGQDFKKQPIVREVLDEKTVLAYLRWLLQSEPDLTDEQIETIYGIRLVRDWTLSLLSEQPATDE